jgi:uncharacterized membrane protein
MNELIDSIPRALTLVAVIGAALMGGLFFAFSSFVMPALRRLPDQEGLTAMQAMNEAAPSSPSLVTALVGTALVSLVLGISAVTRLGGDGGNGGAGLQLAGGVLYLVAFVLTVAYHIPHNDALGLVDPTGPDAAAAWRDYAQPWVLLNHVRALASVAAVASLTLAMRVD